MFQLILGIFKTKQKKVIIIAYFNDAKYLIVNVPIDSNTDFSILDELDSVKEMYLFVGNDDMMAVKQQVEAMQLPYTVNIT